MVFLYGWLSINCDSSAEYGESEYSKTYKAIEEINSLLSKLRWNQVNIEVKNGVPYIWVVIHANHHSDEINEILQLFQVIEERMPQSYGTIYYLNDDIDIDNKGEMIFYASGKVRKVKDPFERGTVFLSGPS